MPLLRSQEQTLLQVTDERHILLINQHFYCNSAAAIEEIFRQGYDYSDDPDHSAPLPWCYEFLVRYKDIDFHFVSNKNHMFFAF